MLSNFNIIKKYTQEHLDFIVQDVELVQELWKGYGWLYRLKGQEGSIILKLTAIDARAEEASEFGQARKRRSYEVEVNWYKFYSFLYRGICCLAEYKNSFVTDQYRFLWLEDLSTQYKPIESFSIEKVKTVIRFLADFHSMSFSDEPEHLWEQGSYWYLDTRPDEFEQMEDVWLHHHAKFLDQTLKSSPYQTFIHGDSKMANYLFDEDNNIAAVDFQYVGKGCGMRDLVSLFSGLGPKMNSILEEELLGIYFTQLERRCKAAGYLFDFKDLERNWRLLYPVAWADYARFLDGWAPHHWKITPYLQEQIEKVQKQLLP